MRFQKRFGLRKMRWVQTGLLRELALSEVPATANFGIGALHIPDFYSLFGSDLASESILCVAVDHV